MAILSLVGKQMRNMVGIAGLMFTTLAQGNVNIEMISQGASEINISCVIDERDAVKALNLIHQSCLQIKPEATRGRGECAPSSLKGPLTKYVSQWARGCSSALKRVEKEKATCCCYTQLFSLGLFIHSYLSGFLFCLEQQAACHRSLFVYSTYSNASLRFNSDSYFRRDSCRPF
jgi:hypothetical protein